MNNKKAFTLIELLVVVLIIGILAAVALPKYQAVVDKSRYMQMLVIGKALQTAQEVYFLANGNYSMSLDELDMAIPTQASGHESISDITNFSKLGFSIWLYNTYAVFMGPHNTRLTVFYKFQPGEYQDKAGQLLCYGWDTRSVKVCQSLGKLVTEPFDTAHLENNHYIIN